MSKIDTSKIEGYENMSAEEKLKALEGYEIEEKTVDEKKWKDAVDKATSEAAKYKKELRDKMDENERREAERKEADEKKDAQLQELLREKSIAEYSAKFLSLGYDDELAKESAAALASTDFTKVFDNLAKHLEKRDAKVKEELVKRNPTPKGGSHYSTDNITKEQFDKMSLVERNKLFNENEELYKQLVGKGD